MLRSCIRPALAALIVAMASLGSTGCESAGIRDAYMAKDSAGRMKTGVFPYEGTEIHLFVEFVSGRDDALLSVDFRLGELEFVEDEYAPGKGEHEVDISLFIKAENGVEMHEGPWIPGDYAVDLWVDDRFDRTVTFMIEQPPQP